LVFLTSHRESGDQEPARRSTGSAEVHPGHGARAGSHQGQASAGERERASSCRWIASRICIHVLRVFVLTTCAQRLTVPQANEILDQQINDIERLTEEISTTGKKVDVAREEVSRTAKEVSAGASADARQGLLPRGFSSTSSGLGDDWDTPC
jgi:hypothetical protein